MKQNLKNVLLASAIFTASLSILSCNQENGTGDVPTTTSVETVIVPAEANSTVTVTFSMEDNWEIGSTPSWLSITPISGSAGENELTFQTTATNESIYERMETFELRVGTKLMKSMVFQRGSKGIEVSRTSYSAQHTGGEITIEVMTNTEFTVTPNEDWITVRSIEYNLDSTILEDNKTYSDVRLANFVINVSENTSNDGIRPATLTLSVNDLTSDITVYQMSLADWTKSFHRKSLALRFTATSCGYCPRMAYGFKNAVEQLPDRIIPMSVYGVMSGDTFLSDGWRNLMSQFNIRGYPTGVVNAIGQVQNYSDNIITNMIVGLAEEAIESYPAQTGISAVCSTSDSEISINCSVYTKEDKTYSLHAYLVEDGIVRNQSTYESQYPAGNNYVHNYVQRSALTTVGTGSEISGAANGVSYWNTTYNISSGVIENMDNAYLIVFVTYENDSTPTGNVDNVLYTDYGFIVDNVVKIPLNGTVDLTYEE